MGKGMVFGVLGVLALGAGAWWLQQGSGAPAAGRAAAAGAASAPPVSVTTVVAERRDWPLQIAANGVVTPLNTVDIRAQVSAVVTSVHIREGQFVKAGELLFSLDSRGGIGASRRCGRTTACLLYPESRHRMFMNPPPS